MNRWLGKLAIMALVAGFPGEGPAYSERFDLLACIDPSLMAMGVDPSRRCGSVEPCPIPTRESGGDEMKGNQGLRLGLLLLLSSSLAP